MLDNPGSTPGTNGCVRSSTYFKAWSVIRIGAAGDQTILGGAFDDRLNGRSGDDILEALGGADRLFGGKGGDTLAGGFGLDKLTGGKGADRFEFASKSGSNADTISDFKPQTDEIALDSAVFGLPEGDLPMKAFVIGKAAGAADDRMIYDDATGKLFFDPDGTGQQAQVLIATLTGAPVIAVGDFVVI